MRLTVVAILAVLVAGCGRYVGPADHESSHHEASSQAAAEPTIETHKAITLKVIVRDVTPLNIYDDQCRLEEPIPSYHELYVNAFDDSGMTIQSKSFVVPAVATKVPGAWCEAPPVTVRIAKADSYASFVATEGQGIADESAPIYPHVFSAWDGATVFISE